MVGLVLVFIAAFVWIARRLRIRREAHLLAARALAEAEALRREREILADLEARFHET
jgi:hypothetical protein